MKDQERQQKRKPIKSFNQLKKMIIDNGNYLECFICLNLGFRSSKKFQHWDDGTWNILHEIDDTEVEYANDKEFLSNEPFIMEAIEKGALYQYK